MKSGIILYTLLSLGILSGCAPSISTLTDMRSITGDRKAESEQRALLAEFVKGGQSAVWRAEAMNTLAFLDSDFMQGTHHPVLHNRLVRALQEEYVKPKAETSTSAQERYRLRAWSIHALSRLDQPFFLDFFANILAERNANTDGKYLLRLAAINGVLREKKQLVTSNDLRHKIFTACAGIKSEIRYRTKFEPTAGKLGNAISELESNLLSYKDAVEMLPRKNSAYADPGQFLQLLRWCERGIVQDKAKQTKPKIYAENIRKLLGLSKHPHVKIRTRVRAMLVQYAPLDLFLKLTDEAKTTKKLELEDLKHVLRLMSALDTKKGGVPQTEQNAYVAARSAVLIQFFEDIENHGLSTRDYVLGRLLGLDITLFAKLMYDYRGELQKAHLKPASLYLRYLHHAYTTLQPGVDPKTKEHLEATICGWACSKYLPVRRLVTATMLKGNPERLIHAKTGCLANFKSWDHVSINELADCFMAALIQIETVPDQATIFSANYKKTHNQSVYVPIAKTLKLRVLSSTKKVAEFLGKRDPELFLNTLSAAMKATSSPLRNHRLQEIILLGDMALEKHSTLSKACKTQVLDTLKATMTPRDEDQSLLCLRYILELKGTIKADFVNAHSAAVRKLYELSKGGKTK